MISTYSMDGTKLTPVNLNRRDIFKLLGFASLSAFLPAETDQVIESADVRVPVQAHLFKLSEVRLLDGPFKRSQELNTEYLLKLEPDRLLAWFRREAGLTPKAPVYPGWESEGVWGDHYSLPGAILGFYLSSMANSYESSDDERTRKRIFDRLNYTVNQLAECQVAFGDGYLLPTKNGHQIFERVARGEIVTSNPLIDGVWEPTYVLNKLTLGLVDVYRAVGIEQARVVLLAVANWFGTAVLNRLDDAQIQQLLVCEHGSLSESYIDCYRLTEDRKYLDWAKLLNDRAMLDPLSQGKDILDGWHANTQIPKFTGFHNVYLYTGQVQYQRAAFNFWRIVTEDRSWVNGGNSTGERFFPSEQTIERMLASSGPESCNTVNMLRLTETLFTDFVDPKLADFYERALYNHVLAVHEPKRGMCSYFTSMRPGHYRTYCSEFESFWCCLGTGIQAASRYGAFIYGKGDERLYVNLFIPSEVYWREMDVTIRQETSFPDKPSTTLTIITKKERRFSLNLRHPRWIKSQFLNVRINGDVQQLASRPGSYVEVNRTWKNGDRVELQLPMEMTLEALRSSDQYSAILYGPILLAGELGAKAITEDEFDQKMDHAAVHTISLAETPVLSGTQAQILSSLKRAESETLSFSLSCPDREIPISVIPLYRLHFQRYAIYWRTFPTDQSRALYRETLKNVERQTAHVKNLALDSVVAGDDQSEKTHGLESVDSVTGIEDTRSWRRGNKGGWLSYLLKVEPGTENCLWVEYHGAEIEENQFSILIDGHRIASEAGLKNFNLPVIYGKIYRIPIDLTANKSSVTVKFQTSWPHVTARIFTIQTMTLTSSSLVA
jgi:DUF1680 family protein